MSPEQSSGCGYSTVYDDDASGDAQAANDVQKKTVRKLPFLIFVIAVNRLLRRSILTVRL